MKKKDFKFITVERGLLILETIKPGKEKEIVKILYGLRDSLKKLSERPDRRPVDTLEYLARIYERNYLSFKNSDDLLKMEEVLKEGIEFNDQRPEFYRLMGELRIIQGKEEIAKEFFRKEADLLLEGYKKEVKYYRDLGVACLKAGERRKAANYLKKAIEVGEKEPKFIESVAILFCRDLKDLENCKALYQELIKLAPNRKKIFQQHLDILIDEIKN